MPVKAAQPDLVTESPTAPATKRIRLEVNGTPIYQQEIDRLAQREKISNQEALRLTVQAQVVAAEAERNGFPGTYLPENRMEQARKYLETVYSAETLCKTISQPQVRKFYELTYKPEWPVDVFRGDVLELRCCPNTEAECPAEEFERCMNLHRPLLQELAPVARAWEKGSTLKLASLQASHPGLTATDFGFVNWPGVPIEKQKRKTLFDAASLEKIMAMKPGQVEGPFESSLGYHLVKLTDLRLAISPESPEFVSQAKKTLCQLRIDETRKHYVSELVKSAVVNEK